MDYKIDDYRMISGISEALNRKYKMFKAKETDEVFLVAIQPNEADNIYQGFTYDTKSDGFGGRWMEFELENGSKIKLQGPWHTNSDSLYKSTGYDIRDKHLTFVVISKGLETKGYSQIMKDIVYMDKEPQVGNFNRGEGIANKMVKELGMSLHLYSKSTGGSSLRMVKH